MVDGTTITIIPPILASVLTYLIAVRRSKVVQIKTISEIQAKAIELVQKAEEQMRLELRIDIERIRKENETLMHKVETLENQRNTSDQVSNSLKEEIHTLRESLYHYKKLADENKSTIEENKREMDYLRKIAFNGNVTDDEDVKKPHKKKLKE